MDTGQIILDLIIILITFFFAAFFVACEFSLVQSRPSALQERLDDEDISASKKKKINREMKMVTNLNEYLSTTQVGVSLAGIILGWIGESFVIGILVSVMELKDFNVNPATAHSVGAIIGVLLLTYLEVVFTEIVPKNISIDMPLKVLNVISGPLHFFHILFYPFVWLLNVSATGVVKLLGIPVANENDEAFSQSEILSLSKDAVKNGDLERNDYLYMQRSFELNDKVARDIMIDRTQLVTIDINDTVQDAINVYIQKKFSRIPVVKDNDKDNILGYVYSYDLVRQSQVDSNVKVGKLLRKISTTPETTPITMVLQQMIKMHQPIVVVIDEYGGTSGLITDKDIYEELFGTVRDEIDPQVNEYIFKQPNGTFQVNGKLNTYDFEKYFDVEMPAFDDSDIVTIAGFIIEQNPHIKVGDVVTIDGFKFKVLDYKNSFINWLEVNKIEPSEEDDDSDAEDDSKDK
ncbi:hemolysin family protein [Fructilactobacillus fructivorans]|uniref:Hemolysin and related protein containing CBS domain n=1 Tax=Fructilactobacillus fructivorans TaxID=1614 RepID=A0A0C1PKA8_9LACO|nr:hemolysin family protein [Fructilactobacillus fructivorans]KID41157.1 hemolysin and related protein containing CBS domain [Fructilactobacillus fructivorans]MCT0151528.1 HlyC/CorC family transporter [Fructilactobacillus fructivorans]MCT2867046.1 HlyC/CorC family transporter [Fructilactobacillus fructivorans]MCT2869348.1 HlyC/CorC family transporter [Fructilactobacillus fructivorans]MCT2873616.1 HlyC/CorC family transporter [Fructilactobacillus fructivorans]